MKVKPDYLHELCPVKLTIYVIKSATQQLRNAWVDLTQLAPHQKRTNSAFSVHLEYRFIGAVVFEHLHETIFYLDSPRDPDDLLRDLCAQLMEGQFRAK